MCVPYWLWYPCFTARCLPIVCSISSKTSGSKFALLSSTRHHGNRKRVRETQGSTTCPPSLLGTHYYLLPGGTRTIKRERIGARACYFQIRTTMIVLKAPFLPHFLSSPPFPLQFHHGTSFKDLSTRGTLLPVPLRFGTVFLLCDCSSALQGCCLLDISTFFIPFVLISLAI